MCRTVPVAVVVALFFAGFGRAQSVDIADQIKRLEGKWLIAHRACNPSKVHSDVAKFLSDLGNEVEIHDSQLTASGPGKQDYRVDLDFDPTSKPKRVDLKLPGDKKPVLLAIYSLEDDILSLVIGTPTERPKSFGWGKDKVLLVLKKARKQN